MTMFETELRKPAKFVSMTGIAIFKKIESIWPVVNVSAFGSKMLAGSSLIGLKASSLFYFTFDSIIFKN